MSTKFYNDIYYSNCDIATISGVPVNELNLIERFLLERIEFQLLVSSEEHEHYERALKTLFMQQ